MKNAKYIVISLVVILMASFAIPVKAQSLEGIEFPSIPQITKPISQMTIPEIKAKIAEIIAVVQQLQALLAKLKPGISGIPGGYVFNTNLKYGTSSQQVIYLQIVLNQNPETRVSDTGWGSPSSESMYFGQKTLNAVIKFQAKHNIQATGYVGPITRAKLNEILQGYGGGTGQQPTTPTTPTTPLPPSETYCGDGITQRPNSKAQIEECDSNDLLNQTCITKGYTGGGTLSCTTQCTFDSSRCASTGTGTGTGTGISQPTGPRCGDNTDNICPSGCTHSQDTNCTYCGDNILQTPNNEGISEVCDNTSLNNQTCITKGYPAGGTLKCSSTCFTFDTLSCSLPASVNNPPVLNSIGNKSVNENQQLSFTISATDPENDSLTYSVTNLPSGATFNATTKIFTWTPSYTQSGTYTLTFTVSDSKLTDTETITITVNNVLVCGDTQCTTGETCSNCPGDCGVCPAVCGDGACNGAETCFTCPGDCGTCPTGNVYYVDPVNGNNSNPGTISLPWKTVSYALGTTSAVVPGSTVYLRGGTYREQVEVKKSGTTGNWITVKSYPGEKAVLDGTDPVTGWAQAQSNDPYLTIQGVVNSHYGNIYWTRIKASVFPSDLSNAIFFEDRVMGRIASDPDQSVGFGEETLEMRNVGEASNGQASYMIDPTLNQEDDYWNGAIIRVFLYNYNANVAQKNVADYIKNEHKIIFDSAMPANLRCDASRKDRYRLVNHPHILDSAGEFYVGSIETVGGTDYRRVYYWPKNTGNLADKMAMASRDFGLWSHSYTAKIDYYLVIEDLTIFGTKGSGVYFVGLGSGSNRGSHVTVRNCTITDCGDHGVYFYNMNYIRAENNYVRRCNNRGIIAILGDYCVAKNNDVGDTESTNINFRSVTNSMMINNTLRGIRGGHGNGTAVYGENPVFCEDVLLAGNQYYNTNMAFNDCRNLTVFANLFRGDVSNPSATLDPWGSRYDGNQVWINNTVPISSDSLGLSQQIVGYADLPRHYVINNILYGLTKGWSENWDLYDPNKVRVEDRTYNVYTYYSWQQQSSLGWSLKTGEQDLRTTPLANMFVNPTYPDGDYRPRGGGPLDGAGKSVQQILSDLGIIAKFPEYDFTKDLAGNPWNSTPSIGAYEYQGAAPQCSGIDTSCGIYPSCQNCNSLDGCSGNSYRNYYCSGTSCVYTEDSCTDCSCSCGGYNITESTANNNCADSKDNDCDGLIDSQDPGCASSTGVIIIDHTAVELYDDIPQYYINEVKKMLLNYPGESHGRGLFYGLELFEQQDSRFAVSSIMSGQPEAQTDQHLRIFRAHWTGSSWDTYGGEEDTYTNQAAINMMNNHFAYSRNTLNNNINAYAFGWCWDMTWHNSPGGTIDPVYQVRWAGSSVGGPDGDLRWGLDAGDASLTGNSINMQTYLNALNNYEQNNPNTTIIYSTGPAEGGGESGYQRYLKHEFIRSWVRNSTNRILFDYADILNYNNAGGNYLVSWTDYGGTSRTFPQRHPDNAGEYDGTGTSIAEGGCHISRDATIRLGKAMWVLLARKAGWDGTPTMPVCSNNIRETGEVCDGIDLGGQTCITQGYTSGTLSCSSNCQGFNTSSCTSAVCTSGQTQSCSTGLLGICSSGTQTCQSSGTWGSCVQNNQPTAENCTDSLDNDCDGTIDCSDSNCSADPACVSTISSDYISYWKFDGNAQDEKVVNNGTIYGNPQFVSGVQGQALDFDGVDDVVNAGTCQDRIFNEDKPITISAWIKPDTLGESSYGWIVGRGGTTSFRLSLTDTIVFVVDGATDLTRRAANNSITMNVWQHVAVTWDGSLTAANAHLYVNGREVSSYLTTTDCVNPVDTSTLVLYIGNSMYFSRTFDGLIDNVMIFNRALSAGEIQNIYDSQKPIAMESSFSKLASILEAIQEILEKIKDLF